MPCLIPAQTVTPHEIEGFGDTVGTVPFTDLPEIRPVEISGQSMIEVRYPQLPGNVGTGNYELAVSNDLSIWESVQNEIVSTEITGGPLDYVTTRFDLGPETTQFYRVEFDYENARPKGVGVYSWPAWWLSRIDANDCPHLKGVPLILKWANLEPAKDDYRFVEEIGQKLQDAASEGFHVFIKVWVSLDDITPEWLFEQGVPRVLTDAVTDPLGNPVNRHFPYYFDPLYQEQFFDLHREIATYLNSLPQNLRDRIVFIQSAEGSTGDEGPYKGDPLNSQYDIGDTKWDNYRLQVWQFLKEQHPGIPILVNGNSNTPAINNWIVNNLPAFATKQGMFSHGFHVSENIQRLEAYNSKKQSAYAAGKEVLSRGEMDAEMTTYEWSTRNIPQSLYWSALMASHCMLDVWNVIYGQLKVEANWPALEFFNKYAGFHHANRSPRVFCALRDGLNAADFDRFPAAVYGGTPGDKRYIQRYLNIQEAYAGYGAVQEDPEAATKGSFANRHRHGRNDVGWNIFPGNYSRFLTQLNPGSGDVGHWTVDESIYGRFARGFENASGKGQMVFRLDPDFYTDPASPHDVRLTVTWLNQGTGSWSLSYANAEGSETHINVHNTGTGDWISQSFVLKRARFTGALSGGDLILRHTSGEDTIFHMIELER